MLVKVYARMANFPKTLLLVRQEYNRHVTMKVLINKNKIYND